MSSDNMMCPTGMDSFLGLASSVSLWVFIRPAGGLHSDEPVGLLSRWASMPSFVA
ncbi:UNVERIFIED_CONTAM: hypothetical protein Slati_1433400 [Sesamum latifolium]|uniref:Uncharacterized protein n=1 Tax=Sesamum latifolium TaxID=2727402 RepID=A0AAW2X9C1_9LAMI